MAKGRFSFVFRFLIFILILALLAQLFSYAMSKIHATEDAATESGAYTACTVVLDAGHGGEDGGAVSASGIYEKDLNLAIAKQLQALLEANGVNVVMTRETDVLLYDRNQNYQGRKKALDLLARRTICEQTPNCIFVSIHMNSYPLSQYSGLQVWYSPNHAQSQLLAQTIQSAVKEGLQPENTRHIKRATGSIYLLHHLTCPAVLVECGFLSNPEEAALLNQPEYQQQLAFFIFLAITEAQASFQTDV